MRSPWTTRFLAPAFAILTAAALGQTTSPAPAITSPAEVDDSKSAVAPSLKLPPVLPINGQAIYNLAPVEGNSGISPISDEHPYPSAVKNATMGLSIR